MEQRINRTYRDDSLPFKLSEAEQVGELNYGQAQESEGIQGCSTVLKWVRKRGHQDWTDASRRAQSASMND